MNRDQFRNNPSLQQKVFAYFAEPTLAYNAGLAKLLGSVKAALIIGQLLYWQDRSSTNGWVYKTARELFFELGLSRREQDLAIRRCQALGILDVKRAGIPAKRHFRVRVNNLVDKLGGGQRKGPAGLTRTGQPVVLQGPSRITPKVETTTQTTQKIIQETTHRRRRGELNLMKRRLLPKSLSPL